MTRIKKRLLGIPSGKVHDIIFRNRNGNTYMSAAPAVVTKSETPKAVEARDRMRLTSPFTSSLVKDLMLRTLWEKLDLPAEGPRGKAIKVNYPLLADKNDISSAKLIPTPNFTIVPENFAWGESGFEFTISPLAGLKKSPMYYPDIAAHGLLHIHNPGLEKKRHLFLPVTSGTIAFRKDIPLGFSIEFTIDDKSDISGYNIIGILLSVILKDKQNLPAYCSEQLYFASEQDTAEAEVKLETDK